MAKISSDNTDNDKENDEAAEDIDSMSLVERIYAENRKKALRAESQIPAALAPAAGTIVSSLMSVAYYSNEEFNLYRNFWYINCCLIKNI